METKLIKTEPQVQITLSPREAMILANLIGNMSVVDKSEVINRYISNPPFLCNNSVKGGVGHDEIAEFDDLYFRLTKTLNY